MGYTGRSSGNKPFDVYDKSEVDAKDALKLDSSVYTATDVLTKLETVDGLGSGLDADLVRGLPADFTSSNATTGYQKLPSGLIVQWVNTPSSVADGDTVTFPIAFPNGIFVATHTANTGGAFCYSVYSISATNCIVAKRDYNGNINNQASSIIAIGY